MTLKWPKKFNQKLNIDDFAKSFGASKKEVSIFCKEAIKAADFNYSVCLPKKREEIFLDVIKKCDNKEFKVSGAHRKPDWSRGWREILKEFQKSGGNLASLLPKDIRPDRPLRYNGNYIISKTHSFESDFTLVFRNWLFKRYFSSYENIYEFGCGTGHNLTVLAGIFPDKTFFGGDWAPESKEILEAISKKYHWKMKGFQFDFFNTDHDLQILPNSVVYTSAALEQVGEDYKKFIDYILEKKPALCINVEPMAEYYDENTLFDYVALKYHKARNYLNGFLTYLRKLEQEGSIEIIATRRLGFGSLYHEANSYIIWKIK